MSPLSMADTIRRDIGLAAIATGLSTVMWMAGWLAPLDRGAGDAFLRLAHRNTVDAPVAAVTIDDRSIEAVGPLPWPRSVVAEIVSAAHRGGAAAVALDLLLSDAGDANDGRTLGKALAEGPSLLAAALGRGGGWLLPHAVFDGAKSAAHVHAEVGPDGVVRTLAATKQADGLSLPAISLSAARILQPEIAIEPGAVLRPVFRPAPGRVLQISVVDLLSSAKKQRSLAGRLVFIGVTATGSGDRLVVPTHPGPAPAPGVLVHASAAASILKTGLVHRPGPWWVTFAVFLTALAPQVLRTRTGSFRPWVAVAIVVVIILVSLAALEVWLLQIPTPVFVVGMIVSILLREGLESRATQRESGRLLQKLLRHHEPDRDPDIPRSSLAKLAALRDLQTAVLRQDTARRTLLDGMNDGVVMWDSAGRTAVVNPAAIRLWGHEPDRGDFDDLDFGEDESETTTVPRAGRRISLARFAIGDGGMALLRDVTAESELERKRRDMQRLVSHELKTPLASIAGFGETLQRYELAPDEQHRVATLIRGESLRLGEMVATFLDLERLGSDEPADATGTVDLGALVDQRLEILSEAARLRGQRVVPDIEAGVTVRGSSDLMARVVDNLVGNALKYSHEGGAVDVSVARDRGNVVLTVTDHGVGIPENALARVFERFYRVPGVEGSGSGLGLAVAAEFVTWHGGCIEVESNVGQGSTFTVRLPMEA